MLWSIVAVDDFSQFVSRGLMLMMVVGETGYFVFKTEASFFADRLVADWIVADWIVDCNVLNPRGTSLVFDAKAARKCRFENDSGARPSTRSSSNDFSTDPTEPAALRQTAYTIVCAVC